MARLIRLLALSFFALGTLGCGGNEAPRFIPDQGVPKPALPDASPTISYRLSGYGSTTINLQPRQQVTLAVQLLANGAGAAGEVVTFAFKGFAGTSNLSAFSGLTNESGITQSILTAGSESGTFEVEARSARAETPVTWTITIAGTVEPQPTNPTLSGTFDMMSTFAINGDFEGSTLGSIVTLLEDVSDDPQDPGKFVVDLIVNELRGDVSNSLLNTVIDIFAQAAYTEANSYLSGSTMVRDLTAIARDLSDLARRFSLTSSLAITQTVESGLVAEHTLRSINWQINGQTVSQTYAQLGLQPPTAPSIAISIENGRLVVDKHAFDLGFGSFLLAGLNTIVIPKYDPTARSLKDLMGRWIDCNTLGRDLNTATGDLLGNSMWTSACNSALLAGGNAIEKEILELANDTSTLEIQGEATITDANHDNVYDRVRNGTWSGKMDLGASSSALGAGNVFSGDRR